MDKYEVAQLLREVGMALEVIDTNPKKAISFYKAAHSIESAYDFDTLIKEKNFKSLAGVGDKISLMIEEILSKGHLRYHQELLKKFPLSLFELKHIPGLNFRKIRTLYETLKITSIKQLEEAIAKKKLVKLTGFQPSFIKKLQTRIKAYKKKHSLLLPQADIVSKGIVSILQPWAKEVVLTGDLRRRLELISEIEILVVSDKKEDCLKHISSHSVVEKVLKRQKNGIHVLLKSGINCKITFVEEKKLSNKFFVSTGSKAHIEELSVPKKDLNENVYEKLGLPFIVPELREGHGEVKAAIKGAFNNLITLDDFKGVFHCHTLASDGSNKLEELAEAAIKRGWEYLGISDHSQSSYQAGGLHIEELLQQIDAIKNLNHKFSQFQLLSGIECDILKDGFLDYPDDVLKQLDFVIVSLHRYFNLDEELMTDRLIKAIENPYTTIIGHLTGRILRSREPYHLNIPKIIDACIANGKVMELNAYPSRLDMDWRYWIKAQEKGLKCAINPDAHSLRDLDNCRYGVDMARKGWLTKESVINTMSLREIKEFLCHPK